LAWGREKEIITWMLAGVAGSRIASNASQNSETSWSVTGLDGPRWSCLSHRSSARNSARSRTFVQDLPNLAASFKNLIVCRRETHGRCLFPGARVKSLGPCIAGDRFHYPANPRRLYGSSAIPLRNQVGDIGEEVKRCLDQCVRSRSSVLAVKRRDGAVVADVGHADWS
jgi:hypothetical protein